MKILAPNHHKQSKATCIQDFTNQVAMMVQTAQDYMTTQTKQQCETTPETPTQLSTQHHKSKKSQKDKWHWEVNK